MTPSGLHVLSLLVVLIIISLVPFVSGWSTGSGTCNAAAASITSQTGRHPITPVLGFYLDFPTSYQPSATVTVTVRNNGVNPNVSNFNGFLAYAVDSQGRRQGAWQADGDTVTTNMFNAVEATQSGGIYSCADAAGSTVTHANGGQKRIGLQLSWTAPDSDVGNLTFHGLVEFSQTLYYTQVLTPWTTCSPSSGSCPAFDPSSLPSGPLPPPTATNSTPSGLDRVDPTSCGPFTPLPYAAVPAGFCVSLYATVDHPRGLFVTDRGDLLVVETGSGNQWGVSGVTLLRDVNGDGVISGGDEYIRIFNQSGLNHALYVRRGLLYVSSGSTVWRLPFDSAQPARPLTDAVVLIQSIPPNHHTSRTVLIDHEGQWLYLTIGSGSNVDPDDSRARVNRYNVTAPVPNGGWQWDDYGDFIQPFAPGLRNEVGLALDLDGTVWGVMNADDDLNRTDLGGYRIHNDNPAERLDRLTLQNFNGKGWYGYPQCWVVDVLANHSRGEIFVWRGDGTDWTTNYTDAWCRQTMIPPTVPLQAHTAPIGLLFYDGKGKYAFPPAFYNQIFIAQHGSWDSDTPRGYKVSRVEWLDRDGEVEASVFDFMAYQGPGAISPQWPHKPVDPKIGVNGELFVSSDNSNAVLVIRHINAEQRPVLVPQAEGAGFDTRRVGGPTLASAEFTFDRPPSNGSASADFRWERGQEPHTGLAAFDGAMRLNASAADSGAGTAAPTWLGGQMSIEAVFFLTAAPALNSTATLFEARRRGEDGDDIISVGVTQQTETDAQLTVFYTSDAGPVTVAAKLPVAVSSWLSVIVSLRDMSSPLSRGSLVTITTRSGNSTASIRQPAAGLPRYAPRVSFIGHPTVASYGALTAAPFRGLLDTLRLYPYALSANQSLLNLALQGEHRTVTPAVGCHFSMQPMESNEPTFSHRGIAAHIAQAAGRQQQTAAALALDTDLFPGWAHFDGQRQYVDLSNAASGIGCNWTADVLPASAFSVELWVQPEEPTGSGDFYLLDASPVLSISSLRSVSPAALAFTFSVGSGDTQTLQVDGALTAGEWSHLLWTADGERSDVFVNGVNRSTASGRPFVSSAPTAPLLAARREADSSISSRFHGSIGTFRVYPVALSPAQVRLLYLTKAEQSFPVAPRPVLSSSSTGTDWPSLPSSSSSSSGGNDGSGGSGGNSGDGDLGDVSLLVGAIVMLLIVGSVVAGCFLYRRRRAISAQQQLGSDGEDRRTALLGDQRLNSNSYGE